MLNITLPSAVRCEISSATTSGTLRMYEVPARDRIFMPW